MLAAVYWIVLILNIILVFNNKKSKIILVIDFLLAFILFYGNTANNDFEYYLRMYNERIWRSKYEIGFSFFMDVCHKLGLSYNVFLGCLWCLFGALIIKVYSKYSNNYPFLFSLYFLYFIFIDVVQIRSFCACSLLTVAFFYYIKGNRLMSLIIVLLSASFHVQMLFFLPLMFLSSESILNQKMIKKGGGVIFILCILIFVLGLKNSVLSSLASFFVSFLGDKDKSVYFETTTRYGFILYFLIHLASIYATFNIRKRIKATIPSDEETIELLNKIITIEMYCMICFPLIMINMNFFRLYKAIIFINIIGWIYGIEKLKENKFNYSWCLALAFLSVALYRIPLIQGNSQIEVILNNNLLFQ